MKLLSKPRSLRLISRKVTLNDLKCYPWNTIQLAGLRDPFTTYDAVDVALTNKFIEAQVRAPAK